MRFKHSLKLFTFICCHIKIQELIRKSRVSHAFIGIEMAWVTTMILSVSISTCVSIATTRGVCYQCSGLQKVTHSFCHSSIKIHPLNIEPFFNPCFIKTCARGFSQTTHMAGQHALDFNDTERRTITISFSDHRFRSFEGSFAQNHVV